MTDHRPKKTIRTIRVAVSNDIYARLAFSAATAGVSVPELARVALLRHIVSGGNIPLDEAAEMLNLDLGRAPPWGPEQDLSDARTEEP
jgi:hypothetical protein